MVHTAMILNVLQAVASVLLTHGRLGFPQLVRFSKQKPRTVRAAILVLVQHNLLWHAQSDEEGTTFEVNTEECLMRLRYGRYVWLAEQLYGKAVSGIYTNQFPKSLTELSKGAEVVQLVLDHGKLRPPNIVSQLSIYDPVKGGIPAPATMSSKRNHVLQSSQVLPSSLRSSTD